MGLWELVPAGKDQRRLRLGRATVGKPWRVSAGVGQPGKQRGGWAAPC